MSRVVRVLLPWLVVLALGCALLGWVLPNTLAQSFDLNFVAGFARSLFVRSAGGIRVPAGFGVELFAEGLRFPTALALGPDGVLYVAQLSGEIVALDEGHAGAMRAHDDVALSGGGGVPVFRSIDGPSSCGLPC